MKRSELIKAIADNEKISKKDRLTAISFIASPEAKGPWKRTILFIYGKWGWKEQGNVYKAIDGAFPFEETPQGRDFWVEIRKAFLPSL